MKKVLLFVFSMVLFACEDNETGVTMEPEDLPGTYWKETIVYRDIYEDGEKTGSYKDTFHGEVIGGGGPSEWYLESANTLIQYLSHADLAGPNPEHSYKVRPCEYSSVERLFVVHEGTGDKAYDTVYKVLEFNAQTLTLVYEWGDEKYSERETTVFRRFFPSDDWKTQAAQYPDYDKIDWSAVNK